MGYCTGDYSSIVRFYSNKGRIYIKDEVNQSLINNVIATFLINNVILTIYSI